MPYLVDGHNLIPNVAGLSLSDSEDEAMLVRMLRWFCARTRKQVTVYFDRGVPGGSRPSTRSGVTVRFTSPPDTADLAIQRHLRRLGGNARNWTVVSSDNEVRRAAKHAGARSLTSRAFAAHLTRPKPTAPGAEKPEAPSSPEEVREWAALFSPSKRKGPSGRP